MKAPSPRVVYASLRVYHLCGAVGTRIYQTRQPSSTHRQSRADVSYLTVNASGRQTGELPRLFFHPIQTRLHQIVRSENWLLYPTIVLWCLGVVLRTFDNLLWPEAPDVPHIHLPRTASLNSKRCILCGFVIVKAPTNKVCNITRNESIHTPKATVEMELRL